MMRRDGRKEAGGNPEEMHSLFHVNAENKGGKQVCKTSLICKIVSKRLCEVALMAGGCLVQRLTL